MYPRHIDLTVCSGVVIEGAHACMTTRGIHKRGVSMVTPQRCSALFREDARTRAEFLQFIEVGTNVIDL